MRKITVLILFILFLSLTFSLATDDGATFTSPIENIKIDGSEFRFEQDNIAFNSVNYLTPQPASLKYTWQLGADVKTENSSLSNWFGSSEYKWIRVSAPYASKYINELDKGAQWFAKSVASDPTGKQEYEGSQGFIQGLKDIVSLIKEQDIKVTINYKDSFKQFNGNKKSLTLKLSNVDDFLIVEDITKEDFGMFFLRKNLSTSESIAADISGSSGATRFDGVKIKSIKYEGTGDNYEYVFDGLIWRVDGKPAYLSEVGQDEFSFNLIKRLGRLSGEAGYIQGLKEILALLSSSSFKGKEIESRLYVTKIDNTGLIIANYDGTITDAVNNYRNFIVPEDKSDPDYGYYKLLLADVEVPSISDYPVTKVKAAYRGFDVIYAFSPSKNWYIINSIRAFAVDFTLNTFGLIPGIGPEDTIPDDLILGKGYDFGLNELINENKTKFGFTLKDILVDQKLLTDEEKVNYETEVSTNPKLYPLDRIKITQLVSINSKNADRFIYYPPLKRVVELLPPKIPEIIASPGSIIPIAEFRLECRNSWYSWAFPAKRFRFNSVSQSALEGQNGRWEVYVLNQWEDVSRVVQGDFVEATYPSELRPLANTLDTSDYVQGSIAILTLTQDGKCSVDADQYNEKGLLESGNNAIKIRSGEFNQKYIFDSTSGKIKLKIERPSVDSYKSVTGYLVGILDKDALIKNGDTFEEYSSFCHKITDNLSGELLATSINCDEKASNMILFKKNIVEGEENWYVIFNGLSANNLGDNSYIWEVSSEKGTATSKIIISPDEKDGKKTVDTNIISGVCKESDLYDLDLDKCVGE